MPTKYSPNARALRRQVLTSRALGWMGQGYHTTMREEPHIGFQRYHHSDRVSSDSSAESTT
jgi:hypothetical protein